MCAFLCLPYTAIGTQTALNWRRSSLRMDSIADLAGECVYQMVDMMVDPRGCPALVPGQQPVAGRGRRACGRSGVYAS